MQDVFPPLSGLVLTFTDFGAQGPYLGQIEALIRARVPRAQLVDLLNNAPVCAPRQSAYLLAALLPYLPTRSIILAVVDPGVGSDRAALLVETGGFVLLGPDNGLMALAVRRFPPARVHRILWRPERLSTSFHGRDLFAPLAAAILAGEWPASQAMGWDEMVGADWPDELPEVIYIDHYGNAMTGLWATRLSPAAIITIGNFSLAYAETFSSVPPGSGFWYANSCGLVELAVNSGRADVQLGLRLGNEVRTASIGEMNCGSFSSAEA